MGFCPGYWKIPSSIAGLYPLGASSTPPSDDKQKCLQTLPYVSWGTKSPPVENNCFNSVFCILGSVLAVIDEIGERIYIHTEYKQMNPSHLPEVARYRFVISFVSARNNLADPKALQPMVSPGGLAKSRQSMVCGLD